MQRVVRLLASSAAVPCRRAQRLPAAAAAEKSDVFFGGRQKPFLAARQKPLLAARPGVILAARQTAGALVDERHADPAENDFAVRA